MIQLSARVLGLDTDRQIWDGRREKASRELHWPIIDPNLFGLDGNGSSLADGSEIGLTGRILRLWGKDNAVSRRWRL